MTGFMLWPPVSVNTSAHKLKKALGKAEIRSGCRNKRFPAAVEADDGR